MRLNPRSVRFRTTAGAAAALCLLLLASGLVINWLVVREVRQAADATLLEQARDRVLLLSAGADPAGLVNVVGDEVIAAVVSPTGGVVAFAGTTDPDGLVGLAAGVVDLEVVLIEGDEEAHLEQVRAAVAVATDGSQVIVGNEGEQVRRTVAAVRSVLLIGGTLVALAGAIIAWFVTGLALRPVHRIRDELDEVVQLSDGRRVSEPGTRDEIDTLASTMNEVLDRLDRQQSVRRQFVADASHELKSPIANTRALVETASGSERRQLLSELDRLQALVEDLLYLAQADEMTRSVPEVFDLDDVAFDEAERAAIRTELTIDASGVQPARALGDRAEVARAVRNLVENATRHGTSRVGVALEPAPGQWVVVVADDGPGIPLADRERIFERFARLDNERSRGGGGTGLGLSIVASIAVRNNGAVAVADNDAQGARLELRIPAADR